MREDRVLEGTLADGRARGLAESSLFHHARNYLGAELVAAALALLSFPLLSHLLTRAEWGRLELFNAVLAVAAGVLDLGARSAIRRYYLDDRDDFPDLLRSALAVVAVFGAVFAVGFAWGHGALAGALGVPSGVLLAAVACAALSLPWHIEWKLATAQERSRSVARMRAARVFAFTALALLLVWATPAGERHAGYMAAAVLVSAGASAAVLPRLLRIARGARIHWKHVRFTLGFGVPMLPHALGGILLVSADRIVIARSAGLADAGLYGAAYALGTLMMMLVMALQQAWTPRFVRDHRRGAHEAILDTARRNAHVVAASALLVVVLREPVFRLLISPTFAPAAAVVPPIVFGAAALYVYMVYANYSFALHRSGLISLATGVAVLANLGLNLWLVPRYGYAAAAWTTLASYVLLVGLHYPLARLVLGQRVVPLGPLVVPMASAAVLAVACDAAAAGLGGGASGLWAVQIPAALACVGWLARAAGSSR